MADLVDALGDALEHRYRWAEPKRPITHRQGLTARMRRIMAVHGGDRRAAAGAAGIPYSTWNKMLAGTTRPGARNLGKLESAFSTLVVAPAIAAKIAAKGYPVTWSVAAVVVADPDGSRYVNVKRDGPSQAQGYRTFNAELTKEAAQGIVTAWVNHGPEGAAQKLLAEIEREYTTPFGFEGDDVDVSFSGRQ